MAKEIEYININGEAYEIIKLYAKMGLTFERFVELLERDFYCPVLAADPTSTTTTYTDTDGGENDFQRGQFALVEDPYSEEGYKVWQCMENDGTTAKWTCAVDVMKAYVQQQQATKQDKVLKFENVAAASWVSDATYTDYPFRCDMACEGVTSDNYAEVVFALEQATSGMYAPLCATSEDVVSIWSASDTTVTVPTVIITI